MDNLTYWTERMERYDAEIVKKSSELIKAYIKAYDEILVKDMAALYAEISTGNVTYTKLLRFRRYKDFIKDIKKLAQELGAAEELFMQDALPEYYVKAYMAAGEKIGLKFTQISKEAAVIAANYPWCGGDYSSRIWDNKGKLIEALKSVIPKAIIEGKSFTDSMFLIKGIMENGAYNCRRLVRTETMHILNQGAIDRYKNAGITKIKFIAAVDYYADGKPRTCETCIGYNGRIFDIDKAPNVPVHPNCRCTYIPVIE